MTIWNAEERAGLGNTAGYVQKLISVPFDMDNRDKGNFDLYYFMPDFPSKKKPEQKKWLLFCSGGPGRVIKPHDSLWFKDLALNGDNVVFFHLRGSGFSQLPEPTKSDKYIRTKYAADDIEAIRKDVFKDFKDTDKKWDAVIGYSYGAALAQQYASKYGDSLEKLILIGPISLERFNTAESYGRAYDEYADAAREVRRTIIDKIYKLSKFEEMTGQQKTTIKEKLFGIDGPVADSSSFKELGIIRTIERSFGSEQTVIEDHKFFKNEGILKHHNLDFEPPFFEALRELELYGWRTDNDGAVNQEEKLTEIGKNIACALIDDLPKALHGSALRGDEKLKAAIPRTNAPRSRRVFEVISVYDGTSKRFMREWRPNQPEHFAGAMSKASGTALGKLPEEIHIAKKIGIEEEEIKRIRPWSPRDYKHQKSTLILAGTADPVTAGDQAQSFLGYYLVGDKSILLEFEGVGHEFLIPAVDINSPAVSDALRGINADTLNCLVDAFVNNPFEVFHDAAKTITDRLLTEEQMRVQIRDASG